MESTQISSTISLIQTKLCTQIETNNGSENWMTAREERNLFRIITYAYVIFALSVYSNFNRSVFWSLQPFRFFRTFWDRILYGAPIQHYRELPWQHRKRKAEFQKQAKASRQWFSLPSFSTDKKNQAEKPERCQIGEFYMGWTSFKRSRHWPDHINGENDAMKLRIRGRNAAVGTLYIGKLRTSRKTQEGSGSRTGD